MTLDWMARQLANRPGGLNLESPRYNPRPPGVIRDGSATAAVLEVLRAHPRQFLSHYQILIQCGRTRKAVNWGLLYLQHLNMVEITSDESRNSRYLRYRLKKED